MTLEQTIRELVARYLIGDVDVDEFEERFVDVTWNAAQSGEREAVALTYAVEAPLSEFTSGYTDENELRRRLVALLQDRWVVSMAINANHQLERHESESLTRSSDARIEPEAVPV